MIQEVKDRTTKAQPTAQQAQSLLMAGLPLELMATQEKRLKALTADEVNRLAKERMAKLPLTVAAAAGPSTRVSMAAPRFALATAMVCSMRRLRSTSSTESNSKWL